MFWWVSRDYASIKTTGTNYGLCTGCTLLCEQTFCRFIGIKHAKSTLLDLKLVFWWVLRDFASIKTTGTNRVRVVQRMHVTMRTNFLSIYSQWPCRIHLIRPKTHVLMRFERCLECENGRYQQGLGCAPNARNCANELSIDLLASNVPNLPY